MIIVILSNYGFKYLKIIILLINLLNMSGTQQSVVLNMSEF